MLDQTPFYDHVRSSLRQFAKEGVLEVMHVLIGTNQGPLRMDELYARFDAPAMEVDDALGALVDAGFVSADDHTFDATDAG